MKKITQNLFSDHVGVRPAIVGVRPIEYQAEVAHEYQPRVRDREKVGRANLIDSILTVEEKHQEVVQEDGGLMSLKLFYTSYL